MTLRSFLSHFFSIFVLIFIIFALSRFLIRTLPGDPIEVMIADTGIQIPEEELRQELGLHLSFTESLKDDFVKLSQGNLGISLITREPVLPVLTDRLKNTLLLTLTTLLFGVPLSLGLGLLSALTESRIGLLAQKFIHTWGALSAALPTPWLGPLLMYFLGVKFAIFPLTHHLGLPTLTLVIGFVGLWSRLVASRLSETKSNPAYQAALGRGLSEGRALWKYSFVPASGALVAYLGTQIGQLMAGAFVTEVIFDWPGLGALFIQSVLSRDYPFIEGAIFLGSVTILMGTFLGDEFQKWLDPREKKS